LQRKVGSESERKAGAMPTRPGAGAGGSTGDPPGWAGAVWGHNFSSAQFRGPQSSVGMRTAAAQSVVASAVCVCTVAQSHLQAHNAHFWNAAPVCGIRVARLLAGVVGCRMAKAYPR